jgi:hypothetical protein
MTRTSALVCGVCGGRATTYSTMRGWLCIKHMLESPVSPNLNEGIRDQQRRAA